MNWRSVPRPRCIILMAFDEDASQVASSAEHQKMQSHYVWILMEPLSVTFEMAGWLGFRVYIPPEGMQAWARKIHETTKSNFDFKVNFEVLCQDRKGMSRYGTTCAESLPFCEEGGITKNI